MKSIYVVEEYFSLYVIPGTIFHKVYRYFENKNFPHSFKEVA